MKENKRMKKKDTKHYLPMKYSYDVKITMEKKQ